MVERGITKPVDVVFRDEELIPDEVIDFVDKYRRQDWIKMVWFTVPLASTKFMLGTCVSYTQWEPGRRWVRLKPSWGVNLPEGDDRVFDQYTTCEFILTTHAPRCQRGSDKKHRRRATPGAGFGERQNLPVLPPINHNDLTRLFFMAF
jgi:hypothetical protein